MGHVEVMQSLDDRIEAIGKQPFRAKFHLRGRDRATAILRGPSAIRAHAHDLIVKGLAPAQPHNDGKQTPYRGHPVFVAQRDRDLLPQLSPEEPRDRAGRRADARAAGLRRRRDLPLDRARARYRGGTIPYS